MDARREVLIVEDDACTRALLGAIADHYGLRPAYAADGAAAMARLRTAAADLILLDLLLPHMNGFEILRELKCTNPGMLPRTVVLTAATDRTLYGCLELAMVRRVLRKPVDVGELAAELLACAAESVVPPVSRSPAAGSPA